MPEQPSVEIDTLFMGILAAIRGKIVFDPNVFDQIQYTSAEEYVALAAPALAFDSATWLQTNPEDAVTEYAKANNVGMFKSHLILTAITHQAGVTDAAGQLFSGQVPVNVIVQTRRFSATTNEEDAARSVRLMALVRQVIHPDVLVLPDSLYRIEGLNDIMYNGAAALIGGDNWIGWRMEYVAFRTEDA